jgi:hypothetical protein
VVVLKSLLEETVTPAPVVLEPEHISEPVPEPLPEPEPEPVLAPEPIVVEPKPVVEPESVLAAQSDEHTSPARPKKKAWKRLMWTLIVLIIVAVVLLGAFIVLSRIAPELLDSILYTKEELDVINYQL